MWLPFGPVVYNEELDVMYIEVEQYFRIRFSPFKPAPAQYVLPSLRPHYFMPSGLTSSHTTPTAV